MCDIRIKKHFMKRLKTRFDIKGNYDTINLEISILIDNHIALIHDFQPKDRVQVIVIYKNKLMRVIYDYTQRLCITVMSMPYRYLIKNACNF